MILRSKRPRLVATPRAAPGEGEAAVAAAGSMVAVRPCGGLG